MERRTDTTKDLEQIWMKQVREVRRAGGITQQEMADHLGMTFSNYTKMERGVIGCRLGVALKIAEVLEMDL